MPMFLLFHCQCKCHVHFITLDHKWKLFHQVFMTKKNMIELKGLQTQEQTLGKKLKLKSHWLSTWQLLRVWELGQQTNFNKAKNNLMLLTTEQLWFQWWNHSRQTKNNSTEEISTIVTLTVLSSPLQDFELLKLFLSTLHFPWLCTKLKVEQYQELQMIQIVVSNTPHANGILSIFVVMSWVKNGEHLRLLGPWLWKQPKSKSSLQLHDKIVSIHSC